MCDYLCSLRKFIDNIEFAHTESLLLVAAFHVEEIALVVHDAFGQGNLSSAVGNGYRHRHFLTSRNDGNLVAGSKALSSDGVCRTCFHCHSGGITVVGYEHVGCVFGILSLLVKGLYLCRGKR